MKKILALSTAFLFAISSPLFAGDFSGTYDCKGHAPGGKEYTDGVLNIQKNGSLYDFAWTFGTEKQSTKGVGVYNSEDDNTVAVLFTFQPPTPKETGVIIYKMDGNNIKGNAILEGKTLIGGESCVKRTS